ncbi:MAG: branched-chain amino acid ABC transporter permease [Thermocladium sp.]
MESLSLYVLVYGILTGTYYAFMALGLNLIFGVMRIINLTHGDMIMLAAYFAEILFAQFHLSPLFSLILVFPLFFALGLIIYYLFVPRLMQSKDPEMNSFILFFGLSMVIESAVFIVFGASYRSLNVNFLPVTYFAIFGYSVPAVIVFMFGVSLLLLLLTYYYLFHTRLGKATRALMDNRELAMSFGINPSKALVMAFSYAVAVTGVAGVLSPYVFGAIYPSEGSLITVLAFVIIIIGALGNPLGSIFGGLIYGVAISLVEIYMPELSYVIPFLLVIVIIIFRPNGLLGGRTREL